MFHPMQEYFGSRSNTSRSNKPLTEEEMIKAAKNARNELNSMIKKEKETGKYVMGKQLMTMDTLTKDRYYVLKNPEDITTSDNSEKNLLTKLLTIPYKSKTSSTMGKSPIKVDFEGLGQVSSESLKGPKTEFIIVSMPKGGAKQKTRKNKKQRKATRRRR